MKALQVYAGPRALSHLWQHGLRARDIAAVPAAAGGPKGLVLSPLDRFIFGKWLPRGGRTVHLLGSSIGAWRMAIACLRDPEAGFRQMAHDYVHQRYEHAPGKPPLPSHVTEVFGAKLLEQFGGHEEEVLQHPRFRLHVFTSRGRHLMRHEHRLAAMVGYGAAFVANAVSRRAMGLWLERVLFSDPRDILPLSLDDYRTRQVPLEARNLRASLLASCSIPFWLDTVRDIPGAPPGAYWDGGITDYHLHLRYASWRAHAEGETALVLYPHFQREIVPGWLDKPWKGRHRTTRSLDNVIVLAPTPQWIATLPGGKLPDRTDFKRFGDDDDARIAAWSTALGESERLRDEFEEGIEKGFPDAHLL